MTSQPQLSKGLTMVWITDRAFISRCRESPDFCLGERTWYLKMGCYVSNPNSQYYIHLIERESRNPKTPFSVLTHIEVNQDHSYSSAPEKKGYSSSVTTHRTTIWHQHMDKIESWVTGFHTHAQLRVVCIFRDVAPSECRINSKTNDLSTQKDIEWPLTSHLPATCELDNLSGDLSSLLEKQHFADLKLTCKGRLFSVHRSVLVARSEFFAKKFEVKSIEYKSTIDVPDVDGDIFELLLKFLYSGKIPNLSNNSAPRLWAAGRTYAVHGLQKACLEWMVRNLSQENCVDCLAISDEFDDVAYKNAVVSFIGSHPQVLKTESWKKFSKAHLKVAVEVYEKAFL